MSEIDYEHMLDGNAEESVGAGGGRSGEESSEDGERKETYLFRTHYLKRGKMLGERHHAGNTAGKSEKRKTANKLVG